MAEVAEKSNQRVALDKAGALAGFTLLIDMGMIDVVITPRFDRALFDEVLEMPVGLR
jgi:hypothetical protein